MSLAFLTPATGVLAPPAESPLHAATAADGATFEARDGWHLAVGFGPARAEELACGEAVGWADVSHLGKLEIQVAADAAGDLAALAGGLALGTAVRAQQAWWCLLSPVQALVLCEPAATAALHDELAARPALRVVDVTTQHAALRLAGPAAREAFARFCALDLRPERAPIGAFRAGSVARTPGCVLREAEDQYLVLVGAALGEYVWTVVADAGRRLDGRPVGVDMIPAPVEREEAGSRA